MLCLTVSMVPVGVACNYSTPTPTPLVAQPTPSIAPIPTCPSGVDWISVVEPQVSSGASNNRLVGCQSLNQGEDVAFDRGGAANAGWISSAQCTFNQLGQSVTPSAAPQPQKVAHVVSRDPSGAVFRMDDAHALCSLKASGDQHIYCGSAVLIASTGDILQARTSCSLDPSLEVAVRRGSAAIKLAGSGQQKIEVLAGKTALIDLATSQVATGEATFTREEESLFEIQAQALAYNVPLSNVYDLVETLKSVPASDIIWAPNDFQSYLASDYGSLSPMCGVGKRSVVFFPANPASSHPTLYGGACGLDTPIIYGVDIYQPSNLRSASQGLLADDGGIAIKHTIFNPPITLSNANTTKMFFWDGSIDTSIGKTNAAPGTYVARFIYTLANDPTPRVGLVAVSVGGFGFPPGV